MDAGCIKRLSDFRRWSVFHVRIKAGRDGVEQGQIGMKYSTLRCLVIGIPFPFSTLVLSGTRAPCMGGHLKQLPY